MYRFLAIPLLMLLLPWFLPRALRFLRLVWRLSFDRRVSLVLRALLPLAILYALSPFDLIKDAIPVVGRVDDLLLLGLAALLLTRLAPRQVVAEHLGHRPNQSRSEERDPSKVVDSTARLIDKE